MKVTFLKESWTLLNLQFAMAIENICSIQPSFPASGFIRPVSGHTLNVLLCSALSIE